MFHENLVSSDFLFFLNFLLILIDTVIAHTYRVKCGLSTADFFTKCWGWQNKPLVSLSNYNLTFVKFIMRVPVSWIVKNLRPVNSLPKTQWQTAAVSSESRWWPSEPSVVVQLNSSSSQLSLTRAWRSCPFQATKQPELSVCLIIPSKSFRFFIFIFELM